MPPVAPGMTIVATLAGLLATLASAVHGSTLLVAMPPGAVFKLTGTPIIVDGINLRLTSTGAGAVLDAQHLSRCIEVQNEGLAQLENLHLRNGRVIDQPGGCALVNGSQSTLTLEGGSLVSCESLMDQFVPPRVSLHGGPYGEVWEASGGGVAAGYGARFEAQSALFEDCHAHLYGGGVFAYRGADVVVRDTDFKHCNAAFGGGVASFSAGTQVLVVGCSIIGSDQLWSIGAGIPMRQGGGLAVSYAGSADVFDSLVANHTLIDGGGAFVVNGGEKLTLTGTTVRDCVAGLFMSGGFTGTPQLMVARSLFHCTRPLLLSTASTAGVFWLMGRANYTFLDTVLEGCKGTMSGGIRQMGGSFYGRNLTIRDCHTGGDTSNQGAGGLTFGGYGTMLRPTAVLEDSTIEGCTNGAGGAGGVHVYKASCVMRRVAISNCHSLQGGGGVRVGVDGSTTMLAGSISRCSSTAGSGGAVLVETGGTFTLAERSLLANCTASFGGLLAIVGGNALLEDAELSRGQTWPGNQDAVGDYPASGGCIYAAADMGQVPVGAVVTLVRSIVQGCIAGVAGEDNATAILNGAPCPAVFRMGNSDEILAAKPWPTLGRGSGVLVDGGPTRVTLVESELIDCVADSGGGAHVQDGTLRLEHGSSIRRCTACDQGGGVGIAAGRLQLVGSAIHECRALGFGGGGISMSAQESGKVELTSVIIARCAAPAVGSEGASIRAPQNLVARNLTISECDPEGGENVALRLSSTSDITLLTLIPACRAVTNGAHPVLSDDRDGEHRYRVTGLRMLPAHGCAVHADTDALMAAALDNVSGWSTTAYDCASDGVICGEHASCSDISVAPGTSLTSPECTCAPPNILPDAAADISSTLMPYREGCLTPRYGASLDVANLVAASVVLRLAKPENASRVLRLQTGGTAAANVTWLIDPSSAPPWLVVDALSGRVNALTETRRDILTLTASTVGLAESREPYGTILRLTSVSMLTTHFEVPVLLFVTAAAHAATSKWGRTFVPGDCTIMDGSTDFEIAITHGEPHRVPFTAWRTSMCKAERGLLVVPMARKPVASPEGPRWCWAALSTQGESPSHSSVYYEAAMPRTAEA
jgi:hypothetical protein